MSNITIAVVGLLCRSAISSNLKTHKTIGLDTSTNKVKAYLEKRDPNRE